MMLNEPHEPNAFPLDDATGFPDFPGIEIAQVHEVEAHLPSLGNLDELQHGVTRPEKILIGVVADDDISELPHERRTHRSFRQATILSNSTGLTYPRVECLRFRL